jgi:glyoxylase-like metal-dependent hydrolase (beta-lactamase superfamily II)
MIVRILRHAGALCIITSTLAVAQSPLQVKVVTASQGGFLVNATLVTGQKDALLIDAMFTLSDAHRLAAAILESKKNLTTIYITHFHADHYFGLVVLKQAFPNVRIVAHVSTIAAIKRTWSDKVKGWKPLYGENITTAPVVPEALQGSTLTLEGESLQVVGNVQGDAADNSYVWIPSLKTVVCGDIVYSGVYPWTLETSPALRKEWIRTLDRIASLHPSVVVAGHKNPSLPDDMTGVQFTKDYLTYYDEVLSSSATGEEFTAKVKSKFPNLALDVILNMASEAAFSRDHNGDQ